MSKLLKSLPLGMVKDARKIRLWKFYFRYACRIFNFLVKFQAQNQPFLKIVCLYVLRGFRIGYLIKKNSYLARLYYSL